MLQSVEQRSIEGTLQSSAEARAPPFSLVWRGRVAFGGALLHSCIFGKLTLKRRTTRLLGRTAGRLGLRAATALLVMVLLLASIILTD